MSILFICLLSPCGVSPTNVLKYFFRHTKSSDTYRKCSSLLQCKPSISSIKSAIRSVSSTAVASCGTNVKRLKSCRFSTAFIRRNEYTPKPVHSNTMDTITAIRIRIRIFMAYIRQLLAKINIYTNKTKQMFQKV